MGRPSWSLALVVGSGRHTQRSLHQEERMWSSMTSVVASKERAVGQRYDIVSFVSTGLWSTDL